MCSIIYNKIFIKILLFELLFYSLQVVWSLCRSKNIHCPFNLYSVCSVTCRGIFWYNSAIHWGHFQSCECKFHTTIAFLNYHINVLPFIILMIVVILGIITWKIPVCCSVSWFLNPGILMNEMFNLFDLLWKILAAAWSSLFNVCILGSKSKSGDFSLLEKHQSSKFMLIRKG